MRASPNFISQCNMKGDHMMTQRDLMSGYDKVAYNVFNLMVLGGLPLIALAIAVQPFAR